MDDRSRLVCQHSNRNYKTCHSLGSTLATLAAFDIKQNLLKDSNIKLVTFNSPRVFNTHVAKEFEKLLLGNDTYRLWREYDRVSVVLTEEGKALTCREKFKATS